MNNFLILTSPPASGKTYWIHSYAATCEAGDILVISPLRALADECKEKWGESIPIMTPEEYLVKRPSPRVVIFDEFHLNFYWGDTFRHRLWEAFYDLCSSCELTIALTATLSQELEEKLQLFTHHFDEMIWFDAGNLRLKFPPQKYIKISSLQWMKELVLNLPEPGVTLLFCEYREEVAHWQKLLEQKGFRVWACVGGESQKMRQRMQEGVRPDYIVATTVLSHGVNLPTITRIFFLYSLKNQDFWIQMVARGGRDGTPYQVFALENPHGIKWSKWSNSLAILGLRLRMLGNTLWEQWDQCFLKESSSTKFPTRNAI